MVWFEAVGFGDGACGGGLLVEGFGGAARGAGEDGIDARL